MSDDSRVEQALRKCDEALAAYEKWEADLILKGESWNTRDGLPQFTQEQYDQLITAQALRNAARASASAALKGDGDGP